MSRHTPGHRRDDGVDRVERGFGVIDVGRDLRGLSARVPAPDLTEEIMGRLGFERAGEGAARRHRARRRLARATAVFAAGLALAAGMHYYTLSQRARRATLPTIPSAVSTSIEESSRAVSDFSRALRTILTPQLAPTMEKGLPGASPVGPRDFQRSRPEMERLEVSRVRWSGLL